MLRLGLMLLLLAAPLAVGAHGGTYEAGFLREPRVGQRTELVVTLTDPRGVEGELRLEVPSWVEVDGDRAWRPAGDLPLQRRWNLTPTRDGYWRASLSEEGAPVEGCCLFIWSIADRSTFHVHPDLAIPGETTVGYHPSFRAVDEATAELAVRVSPQDKRFAGQQLAFEAPIGAPRDRAPANASATFTHSFPLRDGERAEVSAAAFVEVAFEGGNASGPWLVGQQRAGCARFTVERTGGDVREVGRTGCAAVATPPTGRPVPAGATLAAPVALVAAAIALVLRPRLR